MSKTLTKYLCAPLVAVAMLVAGCGGSSSPSSNSSTPSSTASSTAASSTAASSTAASSSGGGGTSGIPQGPNAGDKDSDNNGGPSDGDGNI